MRITEISIVTHNTNKRVLDVIRTFRVVNGIFDRLQYTACHHVKQTAKIHIPNEDYCDLIRDMATRNNNISIWNVYSDLDSFIPIISDTVGYDIKQPTNINIKIGVKYNGVSTILHFNIDHDHDVETFVAKVQSTISILRNS